MSRSKKISNLVVATVKGSPLIADPGQFVDLLPRPHRPTRLSELSRPAKLRRGAGVLAFVSALAMGVSAATASSDWNVRSDDADAR